MNRVMLVGRITRDPELRTSPSGVAFTAFSIAVNRQFANAQGERVADFINCVAWNRTAEFVSKYFTKGSAILIEGELQTRSWEDQNGGKHFVTEVVANEANFCESKKNSETNNTTQNQNAVQGEFGASGWGNPIASIQPNFEELKADDDLPF